MTSPRNVLNTYNFRAKKSLGQHFISDPSILKMIIASSGVAYDDVILEIGAGLGALTIPLAYAAKKVYAVEIDERFIQILRTEILRNNLSNVTVIIENIMKVDIEPIFVDARQKVIVTGNLPYYISSQILVSLIYQRRFIKRAVLMFQKELAQRLVASPGCKDYGRLAVMLQYCADIKPIATISASSFFPKPKVDSKVLMIDFTRSKKYEGHKDVFLFKVIKAAFSKRRKTIKNSISQSELQLAAGEALFALKRSGIDPLRRAETLSVREFVILSETLKEMMP